MRQAAVGRRCGSKFSCIALGGCVEVKALVGRRERMDVALGEVQGVQQGLARLLLIAVGVAIRHPALVTPPEMHPRPVDVCTVRGGGDGREDADSDAPTGENDVHRTLAVEGSLRRADHAARYSPHQFVGVVMHQYSSGHGHSVFCSCPVVFGAPSCRKPIVTTCPNRSSGSSRRSSSARQSRRLRRGSEMSCTGWLGWVRVATVECGRSRRICPDARVRVTPCIPVGASFGWVSSYSTVTWSCNCSHAASNNVEGESDDPCTLTAVMVSYGGWSSTAASWARQRVSRVQAKSTSPGE